MTTIIPPESTVSIAEASEVLLGDFIEYTTYTDYRNKYYRKLTQEEFRQRYKSYSNEFSIILHSEKVLRDDAPQHPNIPFRRYCELSEGWRDMAFDTSTKRDLQRHL